MVTEGTLVAPESVLVEASNILRRLERSGEISRLEANSAHRDLSRLDLELFPFAPFAERVWALRSNLTATPGTHWQKRWVAPWRRSGSCGRATGPVCDIVRRRVVRSYVKGLMTPRGRDCVGNLR